MSGNIQLERDGALARVTLAHAGKFNAMSRHMWRELKSVFQALQADTNLRCVVVRGDGGHFCAGGDIAEYPDFRFDPQALQHFHEVEVWGGLQAMLDCDLPIVAHIEGHCMGGGLEIASCCDLRLANNDTRFGAPIAWLGFPMATREAALVSQAVGDSTARAMLLAAQVFDAPHMLRASFLLQHLPDAVLEMRIQELTRQVLQLAPQAARLNKQTLRALKAVPVAAAQSAYAYAPSAEHREGIDAFLQKRTPLF